VKTIEQLEQELLSAQAEIGRLRMFVENSYHDWDSDHERCYSCCIKCAYENLQLSSEGTLSSPAGERVVPWSVVEEYITARDIYENMHTINKDSTTDRERCEQMGRVNVLASKLFSYSPKKDEVAK
jgi:hypothetical protein